MMWRQLLRFGMVGLFSTFVHMVIGFLLIQSNWQPVMANLIAFTIAFLISFIGHLGFSFADQDVSLSNTLWKFALVALIGLAGNEMLLIVLLSVGDQTEIMSLWTSTGCIAFLTFALSKFWAFRGPAQPR
ncbi:GtrA family protein [Sulfitobacter sp. M21595]|uniref:GtrA family protein n=2 Tax=unclassified Sulfitobacter TaxID=196795 RepID=UPI003744F392